MREINYENFKYETIFEKNSKTNYILSIVIPCHNSAEVIRPMLLSLDLQRFTWDIQLIFVLDNCTDNTYLTIRNNLRNPNYSISILRTSVGYAGVAREIGRCEVKGKYFWSIDSDDYLLRPDAIQTICNILNSDNPPYLHVKYHSDADGWFMKNYGEPPSYPKTFWANIYKNDLIKNVHCNVKVIDDDYEFYDEFLERNNLDKTTWIQTTDYFYYYTQLRDDTISAKYWLNDETKKELYSKITQYYDYLVDTGRLLK